MNQIIWQDPPPSRRGSKGTFRATLDALRERPGQWALIRQGMTRGYGSSVSKARREHPDFEFRTRYSGDTLDVYARYIGTDE